MQSLIVYSSSAQATTRASAPAATVYELQAAKAAKPGSGWADAALAGLPPEDEAVKMAELAATAGRSLEVTVVVCGMSLVLSHVIGWAGSLHLRGKQRKKACVVKFASTILRLQWSPATE